MKTLLIMVIFFSQSTFSQVYSENQKEVLYQRNGESDSKRSFVQEKAQAEEKGKLKLGSAGTCQAIFQFEASLRTFQ
jgi:hypothetical protein